MAFPAKSAVESIESSSDSAPTSKKPSPTGPPKAKPSPRSAADSSLFSSVGQSAMQSGQAGLGSEGAQPQLMSQQALAMIQRGVQLLNLSFPQQPGLIAVLSNAMGQIQSVVTQLTGQNPLMQQGGGMFPQQPPGMGSPIQGPGGVPPAPMGAAPQAGPPPMPPTQ